MAKNLDSLKKAREEKEILTGLVRSFEKFQNEEDKISAQLLVEYEGHAVYILEEDVINFPYAQTLMSLVGENINFTIKEIFPDIIYGSMKEAYDLKVRPVLEIIESGEVVEGEIVYITQHGAYIDVNGVQGFLRNRDFSTGDLEIRAFYKKGDKIRVKFLKYSSRGNLVFEPEIKLEDSKDAMRKNIKPGQTYIGEVVGVYPDRIYVNIVPGVDVLCYYPAFIDNLSEGEHLKISITKVFFADDGRLMVRGECISLIYANKEE